MLNALRKSAKSWVAQVLIGLLVLSFAIWGVNDFIGGVNATNVATVGDTDISAQRFERSLAFSISRLQSQIRQPVTRSEAVAFGIPNQVLSDLVSEAALDDVANRLNLGVSDDRIAADIVNNPALRGPDGQFDRSFLQQTLRSNNMTESDFILDQRSFSERRQIGQSVAGGIGVPKSLIESLHEYSAEERSIRWIVYDADDVDEIAPPAEDVLSAFFEENQSNYRAPEYRSIELIDLTASAISDPDAISDDDARRTYDSQSDRFATPERRRVQQIVFTDRAEADAALEQIRQGQSWAELLTTRGSTTADVEVGLVTQDEMIDQTAAEAAFSLQSETVSEVVEGRFGPILLYVAEIVSASVAEFDDVADQIKNELARDEALDQLFDVRDEIEDALGGGSTLAEAASQNGLTVRTIEAVDASGLDEAGELISDLPLSADLLTAVFESDIDLENPPIETSDEIVWYEVTDVSPARDRELEEVRSEVVADWTLAEVGKALDVLVADRVANLSESEDLTSLLLADEKSAQSGDGIRRSTGAQGLSPDNVEQIFLAKTGQLIALAPVDETVRWIVEITNTNTPEFDADDDRIISLSENVQAAIENEFLVQYIAELQDNLGVTLNQQLLAQMLSADDQH